MTSGIGGAVADESAPPSRRAPFPRAADEDRRRRVRGRRSLGKERLVAALEELDWSAQEGEIAAGELEHHRVQLEAQAHRARQVLQDPMQRVARAGEGVEHHDPRNR